MRTKLKLAGNENIISDMYKRGIFIKDIAKKFSVRERTVSNFIKNNIPDLKITNAIDSAKRRAYNNSFLTIFENINSESSAYFLGFITADGCIYTPKNGQEILSIDLQLGDFNVLEKFKMYSHCKQNIIINTKRNSCRLYIPSNKICNNLRKLGIDNKKTGTEVLPTLPSNMYSHYIRGFFDGNGCIYFGTKNTHHSFSLASGSYKLLYSIKSKLNSLGINTSNVNGNRKDKCLYLSISEKDSIVKIYQYLYEDAYIYMNRKHNKFKKVYEDIINEPN